MTDSILPLLRVTMMKLLSGNLLSLKILMNNKIKKYVSKWLGNHFVSVKSDFT